MRMFRAYTLQEKGIRESEQRERINETCEFRNQIWRPVKKRIVLSEEADIRLMYMNVCVCEIVNQWVPIGCADNGVWCGCLEVVSASVCGRCG